MAEIEMGNTINWGWVQIGVDRNGAPRHCSISVYREDVIAVLEADAERNLPPGTAYELRERLPGDYGGRMFGMAWINRVTPEDAKHKELRNGYRVVKQGQVPPPANEA